MADLEELAGRVEGLTGPDREVDRDIMLLAVPCDRAPFRYWVPMNEHTGHGGVDVSRVYYGPHCAQAVAVPEFTASIDAAMTLVPKGMDWSVGTQTDLGDGKKAWGNTSPGSISFVAESEINTEAATPALALTAAALRARARTRTQGNPNG